MYINIVATKCVVSSYMPHEYCVSTDLVISLHCFLLSLFSNKTFGFREGRLRKIANNEANKIIFEAIEQEKSKDSAKNNLFTILSSSP